MENKRRPNEIAASSISSDNVCQRRVQGKGHLYSRNRKVYVVEIELRYSVVHPSMRRLSLRRPGGSTQIRRSNFIRVGYISGAVAYRF